MTYPSMYNEGILLYEEQVFCSRDIYVFVLLRKRQTSESVTSL